MSNFVACDSIDVNGTSYQGIVTTTFDELVNLSLIHISEPTRLV